MNKQNDTIRVSRGALEAMQDRWQKRSLEYTSTGEVVFEVRAAMLHCANDLDALIAATPQEQSRRFTEQELCAFANIVHWFKTEGGGDQWVNQALLVFHALLNEAKDSAVLSQAQNRFADAEREALAYALEWLPKMVIGAIAYRAEQQEALDVLRAMFAESAAEVIE